MKLIARYPNLEEIAARLPGWATTLVLGVAANEAELGHALPDNSFYKAIALSLCKRG